MSVGSVLSTLVTERQTINRQTGQRQQIPPPGAILPTSKTAKAMGSKATFASVGPLSVPWDIIDPQDWKRIGQAMARDWVVSQSGSGGSGQRGYLVQLGGPSPPASAAAASIGSVPTIPQTGANVAGASNGPSASSGAGAFSNY
jgi:hypothetical protein